MDKISVGILSLRFIGSLLEAAGRMADARGVRRLADAARAGVDVDENMRAVGDALARGDAPDWEAVEQRITEASDRLQA